MILYIIQSENLGYVECKYFLLQCNESYACLQKMSSYLRQEHLKLINYFLYINLAICDKNLGAVHILLAVDMGQSLGVRGEFLFE
jgi:hypothetical protein